MMETLTAVLETAIELAPELQAVAPLIRAVIQPDAGPVTVADGAVIISAFTAAEMTHPALSGLVEIVRKVLSGEQLNDADLTTLRAIADRVDADILNALGESDR